MNDILSIIFGDLPCWYEFSWSEKEPAIILRTHKDFIESTRPIRQDAPIIRSLSEDFGFRSFSGDFTQDFGFENVFKFKSKKGDFIDHIIEIPVIEKQTNEPCNDCGGSGKNKVDSTEECLRCYGKGKAREFVWKIAYAISASFNSFFSYARFPEKKTSFPLFQLMTIQVATIKDMHGGSLGGEFSPSLSNYLVSLEKSDSNLDEITKAMISTHIKMNGRLKPYDKHSFRTYIHDKGRIILDCPGDACGVFIPSEESWYKNRGRKFTCHNTDTPFQQLTLLAGLAALHDKARKEMKI